LRPPRAAVLLAVSGALLVCPGAWAGADLPDKEEAAAILGQFRRSVWQEPTYGEFELRQMPRHGEERTYSGRFWGSRNEEGPVTRFEIDGAPGGVSRHILIQGGPQFQIWTAGGPGAGKPDPAAMLAPLVPGVEIAPFDLLPMPYLYWLDSDLVGVRRIRGRQAYVYMMTPPADFPAGSPAIKAVRAYLDAQYNALEQSEVLKADGGVAKTLSLLELRKVGQRWIPKDMDVRTEATRNKTRLSLTSIGIGVALDPGVFDPSLLGERMGPPSGGNVQRL
jgi:hypothetical protein